MPVNDKLRSESISVESFEKKPYHGSLIKERISGSIRSNVTREDKLSHIGLKTSNTLKGINLDGIDGPVNSRASLPKSSKESNEHIGSSLTKFP